MNRVRVDRLSIRFWREDRPDSVFVGCGNFWVERRGRGGVGVGWVGQVGGWRGGRFDEEIFHETGRVRGENSEAVRDVAFGAVGGEISNGNFGSSRKAGDQG